MYFLKRWWYRTNKNGKIKKKSLICKTNKGIMLVLVAEKHWKSWAIKLNILRKIATTFFQDYWLLFFIIKKFSVKFPVFFSTWIYHTCVETILLQWIVTATAQGLSKE